VAHFIAQVLCESAELTAREENLHYSLANLMGPNCPFKKHFPPQGNLNPADFANNPVKLANEFYGARNGNVQPGDGNSFRGRRLLQLTGRGGYGDATRYQEVS
jgi:putative chitinase